MFSRYATFVFAFLYSFCCAYAQTPSKIVNVYSTYLSQDACSNSIVLEDASLFSEGMSVLIIQMNGASINTSNSNSFGNVNDLNGSGSYELNRIIQINGQEIFLAHSLQHDYLAGHTQVVGAIIEDNIQVDTLITAPAWDGQTGGIVLLEANNSIELLNDIDVSALGFRAGSAYQADDNCSFVTSANNYSYDASNWRAAPKGEGIAAYVSGAENGRGAQANGGGGGNTHNTGGGGGALFGDGGDGGINDEPGFFNCSGNFPGKGGKALTGSTNKLFLGGAGGSGHSNNFNNSFGGQGGGIIVLLAPSIHFSGGQLLANGAHGSSMAGDGAAGGGAAGCIGLQADAITGDVLIQVQGGNGGHVDNQGVDRCFGPGGGGCGGLLLSNQTLTALTDGGLAGETQNSTACSGNNNAQTGDSGHVINQTTMIRGDHFIAPMITAISADTTVCVANTANLNAELNTDGLNLQWQVLDGDNWVDLSDNTQYTGTQTAMLSIIVEQSAAYRLLVGVQSNCFDDIESAAIQVNATATPSASPSFSNNDLIVDCLANASNYDQISWTTSDAQSSTLENPSFSFTSPGNYQIYFEASNECGIVLDTLNVFLGEALVAQFSASSWNGCAPLQVLFTDESTGDISNRQWTFEGGSPASSTAANPLVTFNEIGSFEVSLSVSNSNSENNSSMQVDVYETPTASFSYEIDGLSVSFTNNSLNANSFIWNFGDGQSSTETNPIHTYASAAVYSVSLNASNSFCGNAIGENINVGISQTDESLLKDIVVFPNPSSGMFHLQGAKGATYRLLNPLGQVLQQAMVKDDKMSIDLSTQAKGIYYLHLHINNEQKRICLLNI